MNAKSVTGNNTQQAGKRKKPYQSPGLHIFGTVSSLTKHATGSCTNDGVGCTPVPGGTRRNSERHLKENVVRVGTHPLGIGLYVFDYRAEFVGARRQKRQFGVMVDEVEKVLPEAVSVHPKGFKMVDYAMLGISLRL